jgi:predicted Zn-dependent protease
MIVLRAALVVLAVAAVAWLVVALQASRAQDELARLVAASDPPTAAELDRASRLRRDAERGVPGRRPALLEATLLAAAGDDAAAVRVLEETVEDEPENGEAWLLLARAAEADGDDALAARARERVRALAPEVPLP